MSDESYNNGVAPEPGLIWTGGSWAYPTTGYISGDTMVVWPEDNTRWPVESFNPATGNGFVPATDGMWGYSPSAARPEVLAAIKKVEQGLKSPQWSNFMTASFWRLNPGHTYPNSFGGNDPVITQIPLKNMTNTPVAANLPAPKSVNVHTRITDDVNKGVQYLSVVSDKNNSFDVPVRMMKKTKGKAYYFGMMPGSLGFLEFYIDGETRAPNPNIYDVGTIEVGPLRPAGATVGSNTNDFIAWFPPGSNKEPQYVAFTTRMPPASLNRRQQEQTQAEAKSEAESVKDAIKFTSDFYNVLTDKMGARYAQAAKDLASSVQGQKIRSAEHALKAFDRFSHVLTEKYSATDLNAISTALESANKEQISKNLVKFSKAFGYTSKLIDAYDVVFEEVPKAVKSGNYRPLFVKMESIFAGSAASALAAWSYAIILGTPMGIVGFALMLAIVGALVDDKLIERINATVGV